MSNISNMINNTIKHLMKEFDLAKVIGLEGRKAIRFSHLNQHKSDLELANKSAEFIKFAGPTNSDKDLIYWNFAIIFYIKCFTGGIKRTQLDNTKIYKGNTLALDSFDFYYAIRNKNLIHDENPFSKSIPAGLLNKEGVLPKLKGCFLIGVNGSFLVPDNLRNLKLLINDALSWVNTESVSIGKSLMEELEKEEYSVLLSKPEPEEYIDYGTSLVDSRRDGDF